MITETEIQITERLGITSEVYAELMYDTGCRWLDKLQAEVTMQFPGREQRITEMFAGILRNQLFWRWWTLEWQATDRAYLNNRDQSRRRYFMRQTETPRNMPQNVSRQLLHYAVRYKLSAQETRLAASAAEGVKKTVG
jgi:hypothetical protein